MSARAQQDRVVVALAAVSCGRLSGASEVRADRGRCSAAADRYRVTVTEPGVGAHVVSGRGGDVSPQVVLDHWGGDAEMLNLRTPLTGPVGLATPRERARVAARMIRYYQLDALTIVYPDGVELSAGPGGLVVRGARRGWLRRRPPLVRAALSDLL